MRRIAKIVIRFLKNPFKFYKESVIINLHNKFPVFKRLKKNTPAEKLFISKLNRYKTVWNENASGIVLAQSVFNYEMCIKIAAVSRKIAKDNNANVAVYSADYFVQPKTSVGKFLSTTKFKTYLDHIFLSFAGKVLYRNNDPYFDQDKISTIFKEIKSTINSKNDVLNIQVEGVKIGDLIYDTYLRIANQPQMNIKDPNFDKFLLEALNIFFVSKQKLEENNIIALVTSYTTYNYHGIIARLCLHKNIPVYSIGGYYSIVHKVLREYPSHANNHFLFKKIFEQLPDQKQILEKHKPLFEKRFEGEIDSATSYMKHSAFSKERNPELDDIDWDNSVVILAHCFFDSPHIYRDLLFPDFFDWINFTIQELLKKNITIIVKQHPNGTFQNDDIFEQLKKTYPTVKFIDKKTSQLQIINSRPKAIITAYGTAAAEFSYQGFPVVTIYDNPFTAYDFTYLANTKEEYKNLLANIMLLQAKQKQDEIIQYYYMQHFFFLKGYPVDYLMCSKYKGQTSSDEFLLDYLPNMTESYFQMLDSAVKSGFDVIEFEEKTCKLT